MEEKSSVEVRFAIWLSLMECRGITGEGNIHNGETGIHRPAKRHVRRLRQA